MTDEIYINGVKADTPADTTIYLDYRSNIFSDISKITSNYSYSITLPVTARNMQLIDGCLHVGYVGNAHKVTHRADVYRNGVPLVKGANLYLKKVTPGGIEVAIEWGVGTALLNIINGKDKLTDISELVDHNGDGYTNVPYGVTDEGAQRWLPNYNQGLFGKDVKYNLPVVPVPDIIKGIERKYDITLNISNACNDWVIPITQAKGEDGKFGFMSNNGPSVVPVGSTRIPLFIAQGSYTYTERGVEWKRYNLYNNNAYEFKTTAETKVTANVSCELTIYEAENYATASEVKIVFAEIAVDEQGNHIMSDNILATLSPVNVVGKNPSLPAYKTMYFENSEEFNVDAYNNVSAFLYADDKPIDIVLLGTSPFTMRFDASYDITNIYLEDALLNGQFPVVVNLPDIEVVKFIKAISQMSGTFPVLTGNNTVDFVPFSTIVENKTRSYDWSNYLVTGSAWVPSMEFAQGDEGQVNLFRYKEGDGKEWDGSFAIDNQSLEAEKTLIDLPFKTFRDVMGKAYIPLFTYEDNDGSMVKVLNNDTNPYIMRVITDNGRTIGTSQGIKWDDLLSENYTEYIRVMQDARIITENFRLSAVLLADIQLTIPVYLAQYGAFFAIIEIRTKADDMAEVKLIKL